MAEGVLDRQNGDDSAPPPSFFLYHRCWLVLQQVWSGCQSLQSSPNELWMTYLLKFLDSYSYFSFSIVLTLFLSNDFGYTDVEAGTIYGAWGALITIYGLTTGFVVDNLGVATSVRLGFAVSLVARCLIFVTTSRTWLLFGLYFLLPFGNCLGIPVLTIGIRRYTLESNRGFAFGMFYVIMNVAALLSGPMVDMCTKLYKPNQQDGIGGSNSGKTIDYAPQEWSLTGYRLVNLTCIVANAFAVVVTLTIREIKISESSIGSSAMDGGEVSNGATKVDGLPVIPSAVDNGISTFTPLQGNAWSIFKETIENKGFWRYLVVIMITLNIRMIFRHLDATLPKYMIREFGDNVPYGTIYSINPAIIIFLVPVVTAATSDIDPLVMIHYGTYVSAASVFFLTMSTSVWASILFVIVLSIGEATWSPRLYDYTISVCPEGREGTYSALSSAPLFLATLPVGFMSGYLLQEYCPPEGLRRSKLMWLIIGVTTATSPVFMTLTWKFISHKDKDQDTRYTELPGRGKDSDAAFKDVEEEDEKVETCIT